MNRKIMGSIPSQGTCVGCVFGPWSGCVPGAANQSCALTFMFLSLCLPPFSVKSISVSSGENKKTVQLIKFTAIITVGYLRDAWRTMMGSLEDA